MPTPVENAIARRDAILVILASETWGPDVSELGRSIGLVAYRESLLRELEQLVKIIPQISPPFEVWA